MANPPTLLPSAPPRRPVPATPPNAAPTAAAKARPTMTPQMSKARLGRQDLTRVLREKTPMNVEALPGEVDPLSPMPGSDAAELIPVHTPETPAPATASPVDTGLKDRVETANSRFKDYAKAFNDLRDPRTLGTMNYLNATGHGGLVEFGERTALAEEARLLAHPKDELKAQVKAEAAKAARKPGFDPAQGKVALKAIAQDVRARLGQRLASIKATQLGPIDFANAAAHDTSTPQGAQDRAVRQALDKVFSCHLQFNAAFAVAHRHDGKAKAIKAAEARLDEAMAGARGSLPGKAPVELNLRARDIGGRLPVEILTRMDLMLRAYTDALAKADGADPAKALTTKARCAEEMRDQMAAYTVKLDLIVQLLLKAAQADELRDVEDAWRPLSELAYAIEAFKGALQVPFAQVRALIDEPAAAAPVSPKRRVLARQTPSRKQGTARREAADAALAAVRRAGASDAILAPLPAADLEA